MQWISLSYGYAHTTMRDPLKWIDDDAREERKKLLKPNENQVALAKALEDWGGGWALMGTITFRPNEYECVMQQKHGEMYRNMKVSWLEGNKIVKRVGRDGQMVRGTRGVSPGWSLETAKKQVVRFLMDDPTLRKTRWFAAIESHKFRDCAHGHVLFANAGRVNWERARDNWEKKHGRFQIAAVKDEDGMGMYLAKNYVGKDYGTEKARFCESRNCRRPREDDMPKLGYRYRMMLYLNDCKRKWNKEGKVDKKTGKPYKVATMVGWRNFQRKQLRLQGV